MNINPEMVRDFVLSFGIYGPAIFLVTSFFRPLIFFPITIFYLSSGLAFGPLWGGLIALIGAIISAFVIHVVANKIGIEFLPVRWKEKILMTKKKIENANLITIVLIRFIPLVSFDLVSYAGGLARIKQFPYLLGTAIGVAPRIFAYTYLGANILDVNDPQFWIAIGVLLVIFLVPAILYKFINRYNKPMKE
ncbi:VTT domain-containing protein [Bacillaceae bacterium IKA-2]|nr:VTT domain-containing protein [Bacillaceae bacterium IKA-2]